jgi:putative addiction module killer protein
VLKPGIYQVLVFHDGSHKSPYLSWLSSLDLKTQERIFDRVTRLERGQFGDYKKIDNNLYELRFFFGPGYRVYFGERGGKLILLLTGGDKSSQNRDITKARQDWKAFKEDNHD